MSKIRIRCQVLEAITLINRGTAESVAKLLPHLSASQVQRTLHNLCEDDEVRMVGKEPKVNSGGKPWNIYKIRDDNIPKDTSKKKVYKKKGRKTHNQELRVPAKIDKERNILIVRYRDRKIALLTKLLSCVHGNDNDLLIGCINDYKVKT